MHSVVEKQGNVYRDERNARESGCCNFLCVSSRFQFERSSRRCTASRWKLCDPRTDWLLEAGILFVINISRWINWNRYVSKRGNYSARDCRSQWILRLNTANRVSALSLPTFYSSEKLLHILKNKVSQTIMSFIPNYLYSILIRMIVLKKDKYSCGK